MKLVIDISEDDYRKVQDGRASVSMMRKVIRNGTPLGKIRAEITNIPIIDTDGHNNNWYREPQAIINDVLQIIDKYKAESEEKE